MGASCFIAVPCGCSFATLLFLTFIDRSGVALSGSSSGVSLMESGGLEFAADYVSCVLSMTSCPGDGVAHEQSYGTSMECTR
jgi:hypothetical protein